MIRAYILEVSKMDVEIAVFLKRNPILNLFPPPENINEFKNCFIEKNDL